MKNLPAQSWGIPSIPQALQVPLSFLTPSLTFSRFYFSAKGIGFLSSGWDLRASALFLKVWGLPEAGPDGKGISSFTPYNDSRFCFCANLKPQKKEGAHTLTWPSALGKPWCGFYGFTTGEKRFARLRMPLEGGAGSVPEALKQLKLRMLQVISWRTWQGTGEEMCWAIPTKAAWTTCVLISKCISCLTPPPWGE